MTRKQAPKPHPDWFIALSGGVDSTAAFLLVREALHENYSKRPIPTYFDTRVGLPLNRIYVEQLCDIYDEQLWVLRTEEKFEEWVANDDCPGPGAHPNVRNELKGRQASKLNTLGDPAVHVLGLRAGESATRATMDKVEEKDRHVEVRPVHRLSKQQCARIILEHDECPINPCWIWPDVIADCGCLCNGDPSELDKTEEYFPWFAQRLREIEEAADADGLRDTLGWGGLTTAEQDAAEAGHEQLSICDDPEACSRRRDPVVVRAFKEAIYNGRDAGLAVLEISDDGRQATIHEAADESHKPLTEYLKE